MNESTMRHAIERKREGEALSGATWESIVAAYMDGTVDDGQIAALLMACVFRGLTTTEATALTGAMVDSGARLSYPDGMFVVDKHSSGGVSDIVSLVAVPLVAACGVSVAKLSGRALGHTGGTIDKLETIPGFVVTPDLDAFVKQVERIGCAIAAQSDAFVPADKRLYRLRDRTATVPSIGLIASSIVSKKIAGGASAFVFDVKCGKTAFMADARAATELAQALVDVSRGFDREARALVTDMNEPLGQCIGTAMEVIEARDVLRGTTGDARTREGCLRVATEMLDVAGVNEPHSAAQQALSSGRGYEKLVEMIDAQHGDVASFEAMQRSSQSEPVVADRDGFVTEINGVHLGNAVREWNAHDRFAGIKLLVRTGERIAKGQPLARIYGSSAHRSRVEHAFHIGDRAPEVRSFIHATISG